MKVYAHYGQNSGCYHHRILLPTRYCGTYDFPDHDFTLSLSDPHEDQDAYHLYGLLTQKTMQCIGEWKGKGKKLCWNLDDALSEVPDFNPCKLSKEELAWWWLSRDVADLIICSTPALAKVIDRPSKTVVARNLMEVDSYRTKAPAPVDGKIRILWAGSRTHSKDLDLLDDPIREVMRKWGKEKVEFIFVGTAPGRSVRDYINNGLHLEPGVSLNLYPELLSVIKPHIVLAPLVNVPFNHSKSAIRPLEGFSLAAAVVASPVGEYGAVIQDGVTGLLANSTEEWVGHLDRLISDHQYRERIASNGRKWVGENGDWANPSCRTEWRAAFNRVIEVCGG